MAFTIPIGDFAARGGGPPPGPQQATFRFADYTDNAIDTVLVIDTGVVEWAGAAGNGYSLGMISGYGAPIIGSDGYLTLSWFPQIDDPPDNITIKMMEDWIDAGHSPFTGPQTIFCHVLTPCSNPGFVMNLCGLLIPQWTNFSGGSD